MSVECGGGVKGDSRLISVVLFVYYFCSLLVSIGYSDDINGVSHVFW